jgi:hypothetical protein
MRDASNVVPKAEVLALAARVRELEARFIRTPGLLRPGGERAEPEPEPETATCTITCCSADGFDGIILPGELERLSGAELVRRLDARGYLRFVRR